MTADDNPSFRTNLRERRGELLREMLALNSFEEWYEQPNPERDVLVAEYDSAYAAVLGAMEAYGKRHIPGRFSIGTRLLRAVTRIQDYLTTVGDEVDPDGMIMGVLDDYRNTLITPYSLSFAEIVRDAPEPTSFLEK